MPFLLPGRIDLIAQVLEEAFDRFILLLFGDTSDYEYAPTFESRKQNAGIFEALERFCGDFLNDYEGISGYEVFRSDLTLMYLPAIDPRLGQLVEVLLVPMRVARFRLNRAVGADAEWLCDLLNRLGTPPRNARRAGALPHAYASPLPINDRVESRDHAER